MCGCDVFTPGFCVIENFQVEANLILVCMVSPRVDGHAFHFQTPDLANASASEIDKVMAAVAQSNKGFEPSK